MPGIESDSIEMVIEGFNELLSEEERGQKNTEIYITSFRITIG
jgi:hypothetical protein